MMKAYVHGYSENNGVKDSFFTTSVECKESPLWFHKRGLQQTASGYGKRLVTPYMVKFNDKWRRVYCCQFSNNGTLYIGKLTDNLIVGIEQECIE